MTAVPPPDPAWHDQSVLVAEMTDVNRRISRYITRWLDTDAGRAEPVGADAEDALGRRLAGLGQKLQERARQRVAAPGGKPGLSSGGGATSACRPLVEIHCERIQDDA